LIIHRPDVAELLPARTP